MAVIDLKYTTIEVQDGSGNYVEVKIGTGNLTYSEKRNMEYILDKGLIDTVREGDEIPLELKIDFQWERLTGFGADNLEDALKQQGSAAAWTSSSADTCEPYAVDVVVYYAPPCQVDDADVTDSETFTDFRWESLEHDMRAGQISASGKCNAKIAATGGTLIGS